jgi:hypothetical protein
MTDWLTDTGKTDNLIASKQISCTGIGNAIKPYGILWCIVCSNENYIYISYIVLTSMWKKLVLLQSNP